MNDIKSYILARLRESEIRHEIHTFDSGAIMIDIWVNDRFYCVQIDGDQIGLSKVTKENSFDIIPDKTFKDTTRFKDELEILLQ